MRQPLRANLVSREKRTLGDKTCCLEQSHSLLEVAAASCCLRAGNSQLVEFVPAVDAHSHRL